jgi:hypothetical protein
VKFSKDWIDNQKEIAALGSNFYRKLLPFAIGAILICIAGCLYLGLTGQIPQNTVANMVFFGFMLIIFLIGFRFMLSYCVQFAGMDCEIHNWSYDRYKNRWWWNNFLDKTGHDWRYALASILIMIIVEWMVRFFFHA